MFMSVHKGEGGVKIVPNPVHVVCERPPSSNENLEIFGNFQFKYIDVTYLLPLLLKEKVYEK